MVTNITGGFLQLLETKGGSISHIRQQSHTVPSVLFHVRIPYVIRHREYEIQCRAVNRKCMDELHETDINKCKITN